MLRIVCGQHAGSCCLQWRQQWQQLDAHSVLPACKQSGQVAALPVMCTDWIKCLVPIECGHLFAASAVATRHTYGLNCIAVTLHTLH
jgi:hypothetical protein